MFKRVSSIRSGAITVVSGMMLLVMMPNCAKYEPRSLERSTVQPSKQAGVNVQAKLLSSRETKKLFSGRSIEKKGFEAIQLTIANNTSDTYTLNGASFDIDLEEPSFVARQVEFDTASRVIAWGIPGLFIWPFLIPAIVEGINAPKANRRMQQDFMARGIAPNGKAYISPYSTINKILFVNNKDSVNSFAVRLLNQDTDSSVTLKTNVA